MGIGLLDDGYNDEMARRYKVAVVSVDYRLAPVYPFPGQLEDCKAAARWLLKNRQSEFGTAKIILWVLPQVRIYLQSSRCTSRIPCMT